MKPYSDACDENRDPILAVIRQEFADCRTILEIGSGTGQHAVHFAAALPHLTWQTSDLPAQLPGIRLWLDEAGLPNTPAPLALDVCGAWPALRFDAAFTANTLHIMFWEEVGSFFRGVGRILRQGGLLAVYGPFRYAGRYTSDSNAAFDRGLRQRDPESGIRDFEAVDALARGAGLRLRADHAMPANNRCLVWQRN